MMDRSFVGTATGLMKVSADGGASERVKAGSLLLPDALPGSNGILVSTSISREVY
jgi:hypothetical protein